MFMTNLRRGSTKFVNLTPRFYGRSLNQVIDFPRQFRQLFITQDAFKDIEATSPIRLYNLFMQRPICIEPDWPPVSQRHCTRFAFFPVTSNGVFMFTISFTHCPNGCAHSPTLPVDRPLSSPRTDTGASLAINRSTRQPIDEPERYTASNR